LKNNFPQIERQIERGGDERVAPRNRNRFGGVGVGPDGFGRGCRSSEECLTGSAADGEEEAGGAGLVAAVVHCFGAGSCAAVAGVEEGAGEG